MTGSQVCVLLRRYEDCRRLRESSGGTARRGLRSRTSILRRLETTTSSGRQSCRVFAGSLSAPSRGARDATRWQLLGFDPDRGQRLRIRPRSGEGRTVRTARVSLPAGSDIQSLLPLTAISSGEFSSDHAGHDTTRCGRRATVLEHEARESSRIGGCLLGDRCGMFIGQRHRSARLSGSRDLGVGEQPYG